MDELDIKFTHQNDKELVLQLQAKVFEEKVSNTTRLMAQNMDGESFRILQAALPHYINLEEVVLNGSKIPQGVAEAVAKSDAKILQMESCGLQDDDIGLIADRLAQSQQIEELYLANNDFGDKGRTALLQLAQQKPNVKIDVLRPPVQADSLRSGESDMQMKAEAQQCHVRLEVDFRRLILTNKKYFNIFYCPNVH